ncbi:hypothetical protein quinque_015448 [Culex quinquefasciatus]
MSEATPDDMWTPFKHLFNSIESFLVTPAGGAGQQQEQNVASLDALLRKHKQNFSTLLRNPPKNGKSREAIRQGITEGITLPEFGHTILSKDLVDESVILSDMYDLNELIVLELLCTAQQQMPNHPGLPRGLVAVLLYYDGRKSLVASLKELFQARAGVSWCTDAPQEITQLITAYTDGLVADGLLDKIVDLLGELDVTKELDVLTTNRALGPPKHHRQVLDLFEEIRVLLATCLFNWAAQCGLPKGTTVKLIRHLAKYKSTVSSGGIDNVTLALQMALMYALDMSVIQRREDGEDVVKRLPMVRDGEFIETVMETLSASWECEGLRSVSLFTFGLAIATLRLAPQNMYSNTARIIDQDELLVDAAIQGRVFDFIHYTLLENEVLFRTEFYYRRMHVLFTDFIELMHSKVTELRARADETARTVQAFQQQGLDPPANLCRNFEALLLSSELEEIESRNETYPLTLGMLDLLYTLCETAIPKGIGAGPRKPGLDPYVTFIIDAVFLRFYNRNYKNPAEKWQIAEKCLQLLHAFVRNYTPSPQDFPSPTAVREENSPPGFHILLQVNTKSDFLRLLLHIIDESCTLFDSYTPFPGRKHLEATSLYALQILERALETQEDFFNAHFTSNCSILLAGANKLLLGLNPRSGKADHMLNVTRFVTYSSWLPENALVAIRILAAIMRQPNVNQQILGLFTQNERITNEIRQGFVECLESERVSEFQQQEDELDEFSGGGGGSSVELLIKEAIVALLADCLPQQATPNLAHYLLGFELNKELRLTNLQQPGVLNFPSNCAKSLITLLDGALEQSKSGKSLAPAHERLVENAYALLYTLCYNSRTSEVILRFLRSCNDFLCRHIQGLPFANVASPHVLNQMTGLLKCLLDCLNFEIKSLEKPKWDYFDNAVLAGLFQSCELAVAGGLKLVDIKRMHDVLKDELNSVQTTIAAGQRAHILAEIESILVYALQVNSQRNLCASTVRFLEAWGQVTEVLFSVTPAMFVSLDVKKGLLVEIVQAVLGKVVPNQTMPELANLASSSVLLLMVNLRHCYSLKNSGQEGVQGASLVAGSFSGQVGGMFSPKTNTLSLRYILQNILEWILISGVGSQKLRINLYAALLNYMHIVKGNRDQSEKEQADGGGISPRDEFYVSRLDKSLGKALDGTTHGTSDESHAQIEMVIEIFQSFGDKLIDILCHDCTGGHDICKMLALSCIDMLLDMDSLASVIQFISKRGYLAHLIDSLLKSDGRLCRILDKQPENMKALYVYESKLAMLSRIGGSHIGAELLLEEKALSVLAGMKVFDLHPDFQVVTYSSHSQPSSSFIPPIDARYRQILFPALNLCDVILSTLGQENHSAVTQIIHFLLSHGDTIEIVLRAGTPFLDLGLLQELAGITSLIARAANQEIYNLITPNANQDLRAHLHRLQKLMLTLLPRFTLSEQTLKELNQTILTHSTERERSAHLRYILQIAANLALYARNSISNHAVDHRTISVLFSPQIGESHQGQGETASHSLNIVVVQLKHSVEYYNRERLSLESMLRQRNSLPSLSLDTNVQIQHNNLTERLSSKQEELKRCVFITEHCLYLLWAHLDFFMLRAIPVSTLHFNNVSYGADNYLSAQTEVGWKITAEDVATLKKSLIAVFNETFCKQLLATAQDHARASDKGFIEALLRRIKRLIQFVPVK